MNSAAMEQVFGRIDKRRRFTFVDIGAMGGVPRKWQPLQGSIDIIAFEPDPREFEKLGDGGGVRYFNRFVNQRSEPVTLFIARESGKSSQLRPDMDLLAQFEDAQRYQVVKEEAIPAERVTSLDGFVAEQGIPDIDFIKMDTQGSELSILKGGQETALRQAFGLQVEVEFIPLYEGQPLFRDVDGFLSAQGFQLIDLKRHYWKRKEYYQYRGKGQLIFADALYLKAIPAFCEGLSGSGEAWERKSKAAKAVLACLLYGLFDYAAALVSACAGRGYLDAAEKDRLLSIIKGVSREELPQSLHLGRLHGLLSSWLRRLRPPLSPAWADSDPDIANVSDS